MNLSSAEKIAVQIAAELEPFCAQIQVAGSIRRRRAEIGDIDIVVEPKCAAALRARVLQTKPEVLSDGEFNLEVLLQNGVRLDVWMAKPAEPGLFDVKPGNFGSLLICRTGSIAHNIYLVESAKRLGLRWNPYWGVFDGKGKCLASETEDEIFHHLGVEFIAPEKRER